MERKKLANKIDNILSITKEHSGSKVPQNIKIQIACLEGVGSEYPLSREKLSPILAYYIVKDFYKGFELCRRNSDFKGPEYSVIIHSTNNTIIEELGKVMHVGRIIANPSSFQGAIGDIHKINVQPPTLGCYYNTHSRIIANESTVNLINKKKIAKRLYKKNPEYSLIDKIA